MALARPKKESSIVTVATKKNERKGGKIDSNVSKVKDYILLNVNIPLLKNACIIRQSDSQ